MRRTVTISPPARDLFVVAADEDLGHFVAAKFARAGILGKFQQPVAAGRVASGEGIVLTAFFVAQNAGDEANTSVDDRHRRYLAAVEDIISYRNFVGLQNIENALVKPFISAAEEQEPRLGGQLFHDFLVQGSSPRRKHYQ